MHISGFSRIVCILALLFAAPLAGQERPGPFQHEPRSVRSRDVDQLHIRLELHPDWDQQQLKARAQLSLRMYKPLAAVRLDAADLNVRHVRLKGAQPQTLDHVTRDDSLIISLDRTYQAGEELQLEVNYEVVEPDHGMHFVVPDESEPQQPRMLWTQNEPEFARYWIPCVDTPADRLTSEIVITVPQAYLVLSNGVLRSKVPHDDGTHTWHWVQEKSHVPYLISVVAGEFSAYKQHWGGLPVNSYVPPEQLQNAARSFGKTPEMLDYFSQLTGYRYPWEKYSQICVDEYHWGGMEHTSATTLNVSTLHDERAHLDVSSDNLVAHELAHQWYGDLLTCKDWGEIWLNESFATYFATLWTEHDRGWDEAAWERYEEAQDYLDEDKRYRRSIVTYRYASPQAVFDSHSYPKGARVLHMLRFVLGDELFWKAIQHYTEQHAYSTVETSDFRIAIEQATGQGLNWFFDQWIHHGGHPDYQTRWRYDEDAKLVYLTVKQTQKVDASTPLFQMPVEIELAWQDRSQIHRIYVSKAEETFSIGADQRPERVCFDPNDWILKTLDAVKSKQEWLSQLASDEHPMCRARAAQALEQWSQDQDVSTALQKAALGDAFWAVRQEATKALGSASGEAVRATLMRVAQDDSRSFVRRAALAALENFAHQETRTALREVIRQDPSYYAIAAALRTLVKIAPDDSTEDLLAMLEVESHQQEILQAACDGLAKIKAPEAVAQLTEMLNEPQSPERRVVLIATLARLQPGDDESRQALYDQLDNQRTVVRRRAIEALVELGDPDAIGVLLERRGLEENPRMIRRLDEAIDKLRGKERDLEQLRQEVENLRQQNRDLERRLEKLEEQEER